MNVPEFSGFWQWLGWFLIAAVIGRGFVKFKPNVNATVKQKEKP